MTGLDIMIIKDFDTNTQRGIKSNRLLNQYYFIPHPLLRPYISHYTFLYTHSSNRADYIEPLHLIPDGSGCFIFSQISGRFSARCWGPTTEPVTVAKYSLIGDDKQFFIEFMPGGMYPILSIDQNEILNNKNTLRDINHKLNDLFIQIFNKAKCIDDLVSWMDFTLLRFIEEKTMQDLCLTQVIKNINDSSGNIKTGELSRASNISERHLRRLFKRELGVNIKKYCKLVKLNDTINNFKRADIDKSIYKTLDNIYYDDSHFIKDFKEICGHTPTYYLKNMSAFYNEPFK